MKSQQHWHRLGIARLNECDTSLRAHFLSQAGACTDLGSPFNARVLRLLAAHLDGSSAVGRKILSWPGNWDEDAVALRLAGGLHALVLSGRAEDLAECYPPRLASSDGQLWRVIRKTLYEHEANLLAFLNHPPQTNEVARSAMLLPGFLRIARLTRLPLALFEIGSSAGLNLLWDRYAYRYEVDTWGAPGASPVLTPEVRGAIPNLKGQVEIINRQGSDLSPIRLDDPKNKLRLRAYLWPGQTDRMARLEAALEAALDSPPPVTKCEASEFVVDALRARPHGAVFVLFHSIMWQYLPMPSRRRIERALTIAGEAAEAAAPIAWLRMEPKAEMGPGAYLILTLWPSGEEVLLARADYHGRWIEMLEN